MPFFSPAARFLDFRSFKIPGRQTFRYFISYLLWFNRSAFGFGLLPLFRYRRITLCAVVHQLVLPKPLSGK